MSEKDFKKNNNEEIKSAVALAYEPSDTAPVIVASGKGYIAEKIINTAKEENVPIHRDKGLAESLLKIDIGDAIPEELYPVVAEVLVMVDKAEEKFKKRVKNGQS